MLVHLVPVPQGQRAAGQDELSGGIVEQVVDKPVANATGMDPPRGCREPDLGQVVVGDEVVSGNEPGVRMGQVLVRVAAGLDVLAGDVVNVVTHHGVAMPAAQKDSRAAALDGAAADGVVGPADNRHRAGGAAAPSHREIADRDKGGVCHGDERWSGPESERAPCVVGGYEVQDPRRGIEKDLPRAVHIREQPMDVKPAGGPAHVAASAVWAAPPDRFAYPVV